MSVLSFLMQLEEIPDCLGTMEAAMLRVLAPGPGNWIMPQDLFHLGDAYVNPFTFPSLEKVALAAKLGVIEYEKLDLD